MNIRDNISYKTHPALYRRVHKWVYKTKGKPSFCSFNKDHKNKRFEWANVSGLYLEDCLDWISLCPSCHRKFDYTEEMRKRVSEKSRGRVGRHRIIKQYSLMGKFIKEFYSAREAERETGIIHTSIANVLAGRTKTAGGYIWI